MHKMFSANMKYFKETTSEHIFWICHDISFSYNYDF